MTASEAADLALDPALLMRAVFARSAEERVEAVVAAQGDESLRLRAVSTAQHADDGGFEVVVADPSRHRPEEHERQHVSLQERLLRLGGERDVEGPSGVRQPHHEHPQLDPDPGDRRVELAEVDLGFSARLVGLRHRNLDRVQAKLDLAAGDISGHGHLGQRRAVFSDEAPPYPPRGMPLLPGHAPITQQPAVSTISANGSIAGRARRGYALRGGGTAPANA
jgi:hypothetical protein